MAFEKSEDKRRFHRIFYQSQALLVGPKNQYPCELVDLSLKGCLLEFAEPWSESPADQYVLTLNLSDQIDIVMNLSVAHENGNRVGFKCDHIDIDSICRLRRLVELNLGDSELLERELAALSEPRSAADKPQSK